MMASVHGAHLGTIDEGIKFHIMEDLAEKSSHIDMAEAARDSGLAVEMIDVLKRSDFIERPKYSCDIVRRAVQNVPAHNLRLVFARVTELKIRLEEPYLLPAENWARNWADHIDDDALSDKLEEMVRDIEKRFVGGGQSLKGLESAKLNETNSTIEAGVDEDSSVEKDSGVVEANKTTPQTEMQESEVEHKIESGEGEKARRQYSDASSAWNRKDIASAVGGMPNEEVPHDFAAPGTRHGEYPQWRNVLGAYARHELRVLTFPSEEEIDRAIDIMWNDPTLKRAPRDYADGRTMIAPRELGLLLREQGLAFEELMLTGEEDLSGGSLAEMRRLYGM